MRLYRHTEQKGKRRGYGSLLPVTPLPGSHSECPRDSALGLSRREDVVRVLLIIGFLLLFLFAHNSVCFLSFSQEVNQDKTQYPVLKFRRSFSSYEKDRPLKDPMSLELDRYGGSDEILIADTGNNAVAVFANSGKAKMEVNKNASITAPIGAVFNKKGEIIVAEMDSPLLKVIDVKGSLVEKIDLSRYAKDKKNNFNPGRLYIDNDENLYILDRANQQVVVLDDKRRLKMTFGSEGNDDGQFKMVQDIAIGEDGTVYVVSAKETAVHLFSPRGEFVSRFGQHDYGQENFSFPCGIAIDKKGRIWVIDSFQHILKVFDSKGRFLFERGGQGRGEGQFNFPVDLAFDRKGMLYVLEKGEGRVQVFEVEEREEKK